MLTKKQITLLKPFLGADIFKEYGVRELARAANEKSNNALQLALHQFIKEEIVIERKQGTSKLYKINLMNDLSFTYIDLIKYDGLPKEVIYAIQDIKTEIEKYTLFYSLAIFGSYSTGKQTKKSDLDIVILIPDKNLESNIKIATNMAGIKSLIPLHTQIFTHKEFFDMLINKEFNVGKEIAKKHRAIHNINIFYRIIYEAGEYGFNY